MNEKMLLVTENFKTEVLDVQSFTLFTVAFMADCYK